MSKIFENKTMLIHIAAEFIVIIGLSFYFSQKNKKLMGHINDLIQRIEDQEDMIQKHEQLINNLTNALNDINSKISNNKNLPLQAERITNNKNAKKNVKHQPLNQAPLINNRSKTNIKEKIFEDTLLNHMINRDQAVDIEFHFISPSSNVPLQQNKNISSDSKVEEIIEEDTENEEDNDENLDDELEEELNDLN